MPFAREELNSLITKGGFGAFLLTPVNFDLIYRNKKQKQEEQAKAEERSRRDFLEARRRASQLEGVSLTFQERASEDGANVMPYIIDAVNAGATSGEICNMWRRVFGEHKEHVVV